jgi:hypothetical protein
MLQYQFSKQCYTYQNSEQQAHKYLALSFFVCVFVNVIQKFQKQDTEHSSQNWYCPAENMMSGVPSVRKRQLGKLLGKDGKVLLK